MRFRIVSDVPEKRWDKQTRKKIKPMLLDFMEMRARVAKVEVEAGEYSSPESLSESLNQSAKNARLPIHSVIRGTEVYIQKEDE